MIGKAASDGFLHGAASLGRRRHRLQLTAVNTTTAFMPFEELVLLEDVNALGIACRLHDPSEKSIGPSV